MSMRERLCGDQLWMLSKVLLGLVGVPWTTLGLTEQGFGRTSGRGGAYLVAIPNLFWEMDPGSDFGMMCGVWCGEMPLKEAFPGLYDIACNKNSLVAAHMILENGSF
jgi:hypothetical protein